ncbi:MAG: ABC transporter ATP-binding protein [Promethearchaeota archaeon]
MAKIEFKNITKNFGSFEAVKNFNLEVNDEEFVCLVGPSGCGKTTTLRMLAGLETISEGTISIDGEVINEVSPKDRNIAMVFQSYALYPHYTIYENLAFGIRNREKIPFAKLLINLVLLLFYGAIIGLYYGFCQLLGLAIPEYTNLIFVAGLLGGIFMLYSFPETRDDIRMLNLRFWAMTMKIRIFQQYLVREENIRQKVKETSELLGIESQLWKKPKQLSGGQRQRVALGRAIIRNPKAFLMDEPLSNLDAKLRVQMRAELERLTKKLRVTTLYVTHDQIEAMTLGNRIVVLNEGIANQVGTPEEVYRQPINRFVAGFIGSPPMNFVEGTIKQENGRLIFISEAFSYKIPEYYQVGLKDFIDKNVTLGVRPEHILLNTPDATLDATIGVLEPIGSDTYVYIDFPIKNSRNSIFDNLEIIVKQEGITKLKVDEPVKVKFMNDQIHFFDNDTDNRILPSGGLCKTHYVAELEKQGLNIES